MVRGDVASRSTPPAEPAAGAPSTVLRGRQLLSLVWASRSDPLGPLSRLPGAPGIVRIADPLTDIFILRSPQDARHVLVTHQDVYSKGVDYRVLGVMLGQGLLTNTDPVGWQRQRRLIAPMFAKRHLAPMGEHMIAAAADWLARWDRQVAAGPVAVDAHAAMNALTLDVVGRALFGTGVDDATTQVAGRAMNEVLHAGSTYLRQGYVTRALMRAGMDLEAALRVRPRPWHRAARAISTMDGIVEQVIAAHRARPDGEGENLLALLLAARDEDTGEPMPPGQVRDEVMTFLAAGHETTANALSWMWLLLSRHPEARERVQAEVDAVLGDRRPTAEDADRLPYTLAVLQEAMRLYPPVPVISRVALRDDVVSGVSIRAGAGVLVLPYAIHRDPSLWPNPEGFDPRRFLAAEHGGSPRADRPRQAFMPFGAGRRICVGSGFALMEGVLLAAMISQRFELDLQPGAHVRPELTITLRPAGPVAMTLRRRAR